MSPIPFILVEPESRQVPFLLSIPHCGTDFPEELVDEYVPELAAAPDDTDWYLDRVYDFAPSLGFTTICPKFSRWVIDLNRDPDSKPLYNDGRIITALCPVTDFTGQSIYADGRTEIAASEIERRLGAYYRPYHDQIDEILGGFVRDFGIALFWDGHSIRRQVPTIQEEPFPDLILGNNDRTSCGNRLIDVALAGLKAGEFNVSHNSPFKGGFLTRSKGDPFKSAHALQLEMSKDLYMTDNETEYSESKALGLKKHLKSVFEVLAAYLMEKAVNRTV